MVSDQVLSIQDSKSIPQQHYQKTVLPTHSLDMIFLSFRFYVKSIYGILEVQNLPFFTHSEELNCDLYEFFHTD